MPSVGTLRVMEWCLESFPAWQFLVLLADSHYPAVPLPLLERRLFFRPASWIPGCGGKKECAQSNVAVAECGPGGRLFWLLLDLVAAPPGPPGDIRRGRAGGGNDELHSI